MPELLRRDGSQQLNNKSSHELAKRINKLITVKIIAGETKVLRRLSYMHTVGSKLDIWGGMAPATL